MRYCETRENEKMSLLKKILLFIIAIQVMVTIQLISIKKFHLEDEVKKFSFDFSTKPKAPQTSQLTPKEYELFALLQASIKETPKKYSSNYLTLGQGYIQQAITDDVEKGAKSLLGKPYVWGATGPNKFDCSGFTQKVFRQAGIRIPRNSRAQAKVGHYVSYKKLKRGDMVFFATNKKHPKRVTHVGIYLEEGKFIHASSGGKRVMISSFKKSHYYKQKFMLGRRVIEGHQTKRVARILTKSHTI